MGLGNVRELIMLSCAFSQSTHLACSQVGGWAGLLIGALETCSWKTCELQILLRISYTQTMCFDQSHHTSFLSKSSLSQLLLSTLFVLFLPSFTPLSLKIYRVHLVLPVGTEPRTIYWNGACNPEEILFFLPQWPSLPIASQLWMGLGEHLPYLCWDFWMAWFCTCSHSHCEFMRAIACHV